LKLAIVGSRGIPAKYGGFETYAQELSLRLAESGMDVTVYCDKQETQEEFYNKVKLKYISCTKDQHPLRYYKESIDDAVRENNNIIISCGQGGSLTILKHRLCRSRSIFITNTDGIEHRRTKWNIIIRTGIRFIGEFVSVLCSNYLIADSVGIKSYLLKTYKFISQSKIYVIEYGAYPIRLFNKNCIDEFYLKRYGYYLVVSRLEPENNMLMIINGFLKSKTEKLLVVVGNLRNTKYIDLLLTKKNNKVIFLNGIYDGDVLISLRGYCYAYCHGHSVGGTNPSLLEALGCGNIVLAHDNIFNREVTNNKMYYFSTEDEFAEQINIIDALCDEIIVSKKDFAIQHVEKYYNWERIVKEYIKMFTAIRDNKVRV
jgi:glycosyltransferase involved in cell wall biosynthesis